MSAFVGMLELIAAHVGRNFLDLATTGRAFVQTALRTQRRPRLAALPAEGDFAALAA
jgi:hypothetical protein